MHGDARARLPAAIGGLVAWLACQPGPDLGRGTPNLACGLILVIASSVESTAFTMSCGLTANANSTHQARRFHLSQRRYAPDGFAANRQRLETGSRICRRGPARGKSSATWGTGFGEVLAVVRY